MPPEIYLHQHSEFSELIHIVGQEHAIDPALVEKDYWIMHCLYGLQLTGFIFELKGGTSLSKGHGIIHRFSEDIDIRIEPPSSMEVSIGRSQNKPAHCESRKRFYDWLAETIDISGIEKVGRDESFDDEKYRSGGIRLHYQNIVGPIDGLKDGILLEVGFDVVTPNAPKGISSWAFDYAVGKVEVIDNRAKEVPCYDPGYTLVEKLQTISTKYRRHQEGNAFPANYLRHYYDVYCLLRIQEVQDFIGTPQYKQHKENRFRSGDNPIIAENEAFLLRDPQQRALYAKEFERRPGLYYQGQPSFEDILTVIQQNLERL